MHGTIPHSCTMCNNKFNTSTKQPLLLQCLHTFCEECLQEQIQQTTDIICPLCSRVTQCPSTSSLSSDYVLRDIVEAAAASDTNKLCELHDDQHPATHWCFDCEQGMCEKLHAVHLRTKTTKNHQTSKLGEQPQVIYKPAMCSVHRKELDLVCKHDSHLPLLVCISCIVTSHQGHQCITASEYIVEKQTEAHDLLEQSKEATDKVIQGAEYVSKELSAISSNIDHVTVSINDYFSKIHADVDECQKKLLVQLKSTATLKENTLSFQHTGLMATLDGIKNTSLLLKATLDDPNSKVKVLLMMEQLQQQLKVIEEVELHPKELAEISFEEAPVDLSDIALIDPSLAETSISSTDNTFPVVLSTHIALSRLQISGERDGMAVELEVENLETGQYNIYLEDPIVSGLSEIHVKFFNGHIAGSPLTVSSKATWAPVFGEKTQISGNKLESKRNEAMGMIQEIFGKAAQTLVIKITHNAHRWAQIALFDSNTPTLNLGNEWSDSLSYYNTFKKVQTKVSIFKLEREEDGMVSLHCDDKFIWRVEVPACYIFVDIYHSSTTAEIIQ